VALGAGWVFSSIYITELVNQHFVFLAVLFNTVLSADDSYGVFYAYVKPW
jgi:hypothetical protein